MATRAPGDVTAVDLGKPTTGGGAATEEALGSIKRRADDRPAG